MCGQIYQYHRLMIFYKNVNFLKNQGLPGKGLNKIYFIYDDDIIDTLQKKTQLFAAIICQYNFYAEMWIFNKFRVI